MKQINELKTLENGSHNKNGIIISVTVREKTNKTSRVWEEKCLQFYPMSL